jgi:DNA-binding transcriptional ArsR family regulator
MSDDTDDQGTTRDYQLDDFADAGTPERLKALGDPLRSRICDLVLERAMSVTELAGRVGRPKGTVAYHVDVLVDAGLLAVVRTRQVRAIVERFYGRTGRTIVVGDTLMPDEFETRGFLAEAFAEARADRQMRSTLRHARIPADRAEEFFERIAALAEEFTGLPRDGDTVWGFVAAVYRTDQPVLGAPT